MIARAGHQHDRSKRVGAQGRDTPRGAVDRTADPGGRRVPEAQYLAIEQRRELKHRPAEFHDRKVRSEDLDVLVAERSLVDASEPRDAEAASQVRAREHQQRVARRVLKKRPSPAWAQHARDLTGRPGNVEVMQDEAPDDGVEAVGGQACALRRRHHQLRGPLRVALDAPAGDVDHRARQIDSGDLGADAQQRQRQIARAAAQLQDAHARLNARRRQQRSVKRTRRRGWHSLGVKRGGQLIVKHALALQAPLMLMLRRADPRRLWILATGHPDASVADRFGGKRFSAATTGAVDERSTRW
jgi:hypothetical protein